MLTTQNSATKKRHSQSVRSVCTYCSRSGLVHNSLWGLDICKGDGGGRVEKKMGVGGGWVGETKGGGQLWDGITSRHQADVTSAIAALFIQPVWYTLAPFVLSKRSNHTLLRHPWPLVLLSSRARSSLPAWTLSTRIPSPFQRRLQNHCCCISLWSSLSDGDKNWSNQALFSSALA